MSNFHSSSSGSNSFSEDLQYFPFYILSTAFRLASLTLSLTYLNDFAFITILLQLISNYIFVFLQEGPKNNKVIIKIMIKISLNFFSRDKETSCCGNWSHFTFYAISESAISVSFGQKFGIISVAKKIFFFQQHVNHHPVFDHIVYSVT